MKLGNLDQNSSQRYVVYNSLCEAPALLAASGQKGGNTPYIPTIKRISKQEYEEIKSNR